MSSDDARETTSQQERQCLWLILVPKAFEDRIIDWLLARDDVESFSSVAIHLHGADPAVLDIAEQVSGRRRKTELRVRLPASRLDAVTAAFVAELRGAEATWLVLPIEAEGRLS